MHAQTFTRPSSRRVFTGVFALSLSMVTFGGDQRSAEAAKEAPSAQQTLTATATRDDGVQLSGKASYAEEAFDLSMSAPKSVKVGEAATFTIKLKAKAGYKVNAEYPIKFKFSDSAGVKPEKKTVRKSDAKVEKKMATMPVKATVQKAGSATVGGKLSFSVCTPERCLIEKRELQVVVNAS